MKGIDFCIASSEDDLHGILELQQQNLASLLSEEDQQSQGFLTVVHSLELLHKINTETPGIVAKDHDKVVGYCLAMSRKFEKEIPILVPMFETADAQVFKDRKVASYNYIVAGQVCVAKEYRGRKLLDGMYGRFRQAYDGLYDFVLTEIATRNKRSLHVHARIGFQTVHSYKAPDGEQWEVVVWDWNKK